VLILPTDYVQYLKILHFFTPLPIHFQLNLNTNTEHVNSLNGFSSQWTTKGVCNSSCKQYVVKGDVHEILFKLTENLSEFCCSLLDLYSAFINCLDHPWVVPDNMGTKSYSKSCCSFIYSLKCWHWFMLLVQQQDCHSCINEWVT